jgi:hypothetical protein
MGGWVEYALMYCGDTKYLHNLSYLKSVRKLNIPFMSYGHNEYLSVAGIASALYSNGDSDIFHQILYLPHITVWQNMPACLGVMSNIFT